jgi:hypothetical protein
MSLIGKITHMLGHDEEQSSLSQKAKKQERLLEHVIDMTDIRITNVANYHDALLPAIQVAEAYFAQTLDCIPGPIALDSPIAVLSQLFPQLGDMAAGLGRSLAVKNGLPALVKAGHSRLYGLLGVRIKSMPEGGQIIVDHTVRSLAANPATVRRLLRIAAFDSLLQGFANDHLHYEKKLEQARMQKELLQETRAMAARPLDTPRPATSIRASHDKQSPEQILASLQDWLYAPQSRLRLETNNAHIITTTKDKEDWRLPRLITQDRRHWYVCLIEFPTNMASKALAAESHNHRFILI